MHPQALQCRWGNRGWEDLLTHISSRKGRGEAAAGPCALSPLHRVPGTLVWAADSPSALLRLWGWRVPGPGPTHPALGHSHSQAHTFRRHCSLKDEGPAALCCRPVCHQAVQCVARVHTGPKSPVFWTLMWGTWSWRREGQPLWGILPLSPPSGQSPCFSRLEVMGSARNSKAKAGPCPARVHQGDRQPVYAPSHL